MKLLPLSWISPGTHPSSCPGWPILTWYWIITRVRMDHPFNWHHAQKCFLRKPKGLQICHEKLWKNRRKLFQEKDFVFQLLTCWRFHVALDDNGWLLDCAVISVAKTVMSVVAIETPVTNETSLAIGLQASMVWPKLPLLKYYLISCLIMIYKFGNSDKNDIFKSYNCSWYNVFNSFLRKINYWFVITLKSFKITHFIY